MRIPDPQPNCLGEAFTRDGARTLSLAARTGMVRRPRYGHWNGDRKQSTLWHIENRNQDAETIHSTQKPVECMRRPILNNSNVGQSVYEPFCGSGTTIIACEKESRIALAIEVDPTYVDVAITRWQNFTGQQAILDGDNRTFAQVSEERMQVAA